MKLLIVSKFLLVSLTRLQNILILHHLRFIMLNSMKELLHALIKTTDEIAENLMKDDSQCGDDGCLSSTKNCVVPSKEAQSKIETFQK